jgi:hypothetical protein
MRDEGLYPLGDQGWRDLAGATFRKINTACTIAPCTTCTLPRHRVHAFVTSDAADLRVFRECARCHTINRIDL